MASSGTRDAADRRLRQVNGRAICAIGMSTGPAAAPLAAAACQPILGAAVLAAELVIVLTLFGIIVFGTQEHVDRVFRLLRWIRNCPEPAGSPTSPDARSIPAPKYRGFSDRTRGRYPARQQG
jgi:hypothetical protein